ncbi:ParH-like protein [Kitasatospora sp. LaBMicrA B282]|uniref:ParH-like protein n=1 Tax=Kitasatospora sp. LaBMicrA B282 TaxID=3420949 RepID=UPI003D0D6F0D
MFGRRSRRGRIWQRCQETVDALEIPVPFDAVRFIESLAERRGRPIELIPVSGRPNLPCGLLITTDAADCIMYSADTTALHQRHILLHEAAHLICRHDESAPAGRVLLPNLGTDLVQRVLGRTVYTEPQEREAELVASMILHRATAGDGARGGPPAGSWTESVFGRAVGGAAEGEAVDGGSVGGGPVDGGPADSGRADGGPAGGMPAGGPR